MLDSALEDLEPSYNLLKNLLLLPWIQRLIVDNIIYHIMVNDSTPLFHAQTDNTVQHTSYSTV